MSKSTRRGVLKGLGGICVGLPFLELFLPKQASAAVAPLRYVVMFAGSSLGMSGMDSVVPSAVGPWSGTPSRGLQPLTDHGVADAATYISNLEIPYGADGSIPAGGRAIPWHASSTCPLLSGVRSASAGNEALQGPTSDWIVANTIGGPTLATRPVLTYRVQAAFYRGSNGTGGDRGLMSMRDNNGTLEKVPPQFSPQIAFNDLSTGFIPPYPAEAAAAQFEL